MVTVQETIQARERIQELRNLRLHDLLDQFEACNQMIISRMLAKTVPDCDFSEVLDLNPTGEELWAGKGQDDEIRLQKMVTFKLPPNEAVLLLDKMCKVTGFPDSVLWFLNSTETEFRQMRIKIEFEVDELTAQIEELVEDSLRKVIREQFTPMLEKIARLEEGLATIEERLE